MGNEVGQELVEPIESVHKRFPLRAWVLRCTKVLSKRLTCLHVPRRARSGRRIDAEIVDHGTWVTPAQKIQHFCRCWSIESPRRERPIVARVQKFVRVGLDQELIESELLRATTVNVDYHLKTSIGSAHRLEGRTTQSLKLHLDRGQLSIYHFPDRFKFIHNSQQGRVHAGAELPRRFIVLVMSTGRYGLELGGFSPWRAAAGKGWNQPLENRRLDGVMTIGRSGLHLATAGRTV